MYAPAKLTQKQLEEVKKLEDQWKDIILLAYQKPVKLAKLSPSQLERMQNLEKELAVILMAYRR